MFGKYFQVSDSDSNKKWHFRTLSEHKRTLFWAATSEHQAVRSSTQHNPKFGNHNYNFFYLAVCNTTVESVMIVFNFLSYGAVLYSSFCYIKFRRIFTFFLFDLTYTMVFYFYGMYESLLKVKMGKILLN